MQNYLSHIIRKPVYAICNNKGADQPAHLHSLISTFIVPCLDSLISLVSLFAISGLSLVRAGLSLTWSQIPKERISHDMAHLSVVLNKAIYL